MMEKSHSIKGLYAITPEERDLFILSLQVELSIRGGAKLIQYRSKTLSKIEQKKQASKIKIICDSGPPASCAPERSLNKNKMSAGQNK